MGSTNDKHDVIVIDLTGSNPKKKRKTSDSYSPKQGEGYRASDDKHGEISQNAIQCEGEIQIVEPSAKSPLKSLTMGGICEHSKDDGMKQRQTNGDQQNMHVIRQTKNDINEITAIKMQQAEFDELKKSVCRIATEMKYYATYKLIPHSLHRKDAMSFTDPLKIYVNKVKMEPGARENKDVPSISFADIASGEFSETLIVTGMYSTVDHQRFLGKYLPPKCKVTFVSPRDDDPKISGAQWPFETEWITAPMYILDNGKKIENRWGSQHAKLHLFLHAFFLRIMITSANGYEVEWDDAGQVIWCLDIPRANHKNGTASSDKSTSHPFACSLATYLEMMFCDYEGSNGRVWIDYILYDFDFSICGDDVSLIASIPSKRVTCPLSSDTYIQNRAAAYDPEQQNMFGLRSIHRILKQKFPRGFFRGSTGNKTENRADYIEVSVSSISNYGFSLHSSVMKAFSGHDRLDWDKLRIFFPSERRTRLSRIEGRMVPRLSKALHLAFLSGKQTLNPTWPIRRYRLLHEYLSCIAQRQTREMRVQHTKMYLRESTVEGLSKGLGWIYVGSANLSYSALGSGLNFDTRKKGTKKEFEAQELVYKTNSYELGILLTKVRIGNYESVIPWSRNNMEAMRYDSDLEPAFSQCT